MVKNKQKSVYPAFWPMELPLVLKVPTKKT